MVSQYTVTHSESREDKVANVPPLHPSSESQLMFYCLQKNSVFSTWLSDKASSQGQQREALRQNSGEIFYLLPDPHHALLSPVNCYITLLSSALRFILVYLVLYLEP